jgi:hypothetical protein
MLFQFQGWSQQASLQPMTVRTLVPLTKTRRVLTVDSVMPQWRRYLPCAHNQKSPPSLACTNYPPVLQGHKIAPETHEMLH